MNNGYRDRARGMLAGLAIGDALGAPVEFGYTSHDIEKLGNTIAKFEDWALPAGAWTDDTSMALCIADSLIDKRGYDSYDIMNKYLLWLEKGYRSSVGYAFGEGHQVARSLHIYEKHKIIPADARKTEDAGNGPIMRLAPIIIANTFPEQCNGKVKNIELKPLVHMSILSCRETHDSVAAECVTEMFATALYSAICGCNKTTIQCYAQRWSQYDRPDYDKFWLMNVEKLINRAFRGGEELKNLGGYIVDAFAIALWGFVHSESFEDGMLKVIRLGGDTDTNAACYGQLAGAYYGYEAIPEKWRKKVYLADEITKIADTLLEMPKCPVIRTRFEDDEDFEAISQEELDGSREYCLRKSEPTDVNKIMKNLIKNCVENAKRSNS